MRVFREETYEDVHVCGYIFWSACDKSQVELRFVAVVC